MPAKPAKKSPKKAAKKAPKKTVAAKSASARKQAAKHPLPANRKPAVAKPSAADKERPAAKLEIKPDRVAAILKILAETYADAECALTHRSPWELLVATILSAQCTDARVNMVTPKLFETYPTPKAMSEAPIEAIEQLIRTTGFYHNKAKSIQGAGRVIHEQFRDKVPETMAELLTVPGAARKTASVVLGVSYGKAEGIVVDTHVFRLSRRLGFTKSDTAAKVEQDLMKIIPHDHWIQFSHELIHHGRQICEARKPKCSECPLEQICHAPDKTWSS
ncbi:endonuclease III [Acidicapsa dinghuensis]|uniref:Endonuclease III n=1 Tax=Acidicapsa dinghuensis TaxID=2218256 RepID=A0ABW1EKW3_9BACT|nr:endonuclease III [Acidicapsa dinghuensis]